MLAMILSLFLSLPSPCRSASFPASKELEALVQSFAHAHYQKSFRYLGDENDFDHGHFLFAPGAERPSAILYHTQEMAPTYRRLKPGGKYDYIDAEGRNWIQFIDRPERIVNAQEFLKDGLREHPRFREYRTITDKMLDQERLGMKIERTVQWVFNQTDCDERNGQLLVIRLGSGQAACLRSSLEQNLYTGAVVEPAAGALR